MEMKSLQDLKLSASAEKTVRKLVAALESTLGGQLKSVVLFAHGAGQGWGSRLELNAVLRLRELERVDSPSPNELPLRVTLYSDGSGG